MKNNLKMSMGAGLVLGLAMLMFVAVPRASAFTENITVGESMAVGSTGDDVVILQGLMSELGYLQVPAGVPLGYFGSLTRNAVAQYQASLGVSPADGNFGPMTGLAMHNQFAVHGWNALLGW